MPALPTAGASPVLVPAASVPNHEPPEQPADSVGVPASVSVICWPLVDGSTSLKLTPVTAPPDQLSTTTVNVVDCPGAMLAGTADFDAMVSCASAVNVAVAAGLWCPAGLATASAAIVLTCGPSIEVVT